MIDEDGGADVVEVVGDSPLRSDEAGPVLKWRRRGDTWEGLVTQEMGDGRLLAAWLPALVLGPPLDSPPA